MRRLAAVPGVWRVLAAIGRQLARRSRTADLTGFTPTELGLVEIARADLDRFTRERRYTLRGVGMRNDALQIAARREIPWGSEEVPTIVLHGDTDSVVPLEHGRHYAEVIPGARLEVLTDHGHAVPLFARARVAELVRELLSSAPGRTSQEAACRPAEPPR
jgi:pimeloyl-ACP methyl ester carboxylesterase